MTEEDLREQFVVHVLTSGFNQAAESFSRIMKQPVKIWLPQSVVVRQGRQFSYISEEKGEVYILVTHLMGDFAGKSFLIFSEAEVIEIIAALHNNRYQAPEFRDAMLLEIDNILSASVISQLSNEFNAEIYGDVPELKKLKAEDLHDFISEGDERSRDSYTVIYSNATFRFTSQGEEVHPQFIWKLSSKIFDMVPADRIVHVK